MFGSNPIRKQTTHDDVWIEEVFRTIQGEGPFSGFPAIFVRLCGCNLKCFWCDTKFESFEWNPSPQELFTRIQQLDILKCGLVVITGGEPFRQNIIPHINILLDNNYKVQLETNGTLYLPMQKNKYLTIVCSPKTAKINKKTFPLITHFKYVLAYNELDLKDGLPDMSTQIKNKKNRLFRPPYNIPIYVMPRDDYDEEKNSKNLKVCVYVSLKFGYRLNIQLHKTFNLP